MIGIAADVGGGRSRGWVVNGLPGFSRYQNVVRADRLDLASFEDDARDDIKLPLAHGEITNSAFDPFPDATVQRSRFGHHIRQRKALLLCPSVGHIAGRRHMTAVIAAASVVGELGLIVNRKATIRTEFPATGCLARLAERVCRGMFC